VCSPIDTTEKANGARLNDGRQMAGVSRGYRLTMLAFEKSEQLELGLGM
jgi:hypothetical protein